METTPRSDLREIYRILTEIKPAIESEKRKYGIRDITPPDASFAGEERAKLTAISEDVVAAFLAAVSEDDFQSRLSQKKWADDPTVPKITNWLTQSPQRPWLIFLTLATMGSIRDEVIALVGAKMHSKPA